MSDPNQPSQKSTPENKPLGRVLIAAGSDSGGGAGIQADIKSVMAMGGYAMTAITAITIQDTTGVHGVVGVPVSAVRDQIRVCLADIGADAIKTGMLGDKAMTLAVAEMLHSHASGIPAIIDPVMVAKGGASLLQNDAIEALKSELLPLAFLLTPNAPEAERLAKVAVENLDGQRRAAERLLRAGAKAVLIKGAHIGGDVITDLLATEKEELFFESKRIVSTSTHGTGCTLASAIASLIAQGKTLPDSVEEARAYVLEAIRRAPGLGKGHGPLDHGWPVKQAREMLR
ncbi:MAG: bifunctional hydroxymethylpyrimidine kinase/phosphomethylpyrimidine kinase [Caulobacterales bacterium]